jgi:hypothetical protein
LADTVAHWQDTESVDVLKVVDTMMLLGIPVPETTFYLITKQTAGFVSDEAKIPSSLMP